jgi:hypothetical protein
VSIVAPYAEPSVIEHVDVHFGIGYEAVVLSGDAWIINGSGIEHRVRTVRERERERERNKRWRAEKDGKRK